MILFLEQFLAAVGLKIPTVFTYSSTRMMLAALTSLLLTIVLGPRVIRKLFELKTGQSIRVEDCPALIKLHEKKKETPTMGGILILFSMLVSLVIWMDLRSSFTLILAVTTVWLGLLGGMDDYLKMKHKNSKGLSGKKKLLLQMTLGGLIALYLYCPAVTESLHHGKWFPPPAAKEQVIALKKSDGKVDLVGIPLDTQQYMGRYYVPFYKDPVVVATGLGILVAACFTIFILTGTSNAVNLTDGLDGLAAGCLVMVAAVLGVFAFFSNNIEMARYLNIMYIEESGEIAIFLFAMIGACLGFLWYNGHPAQVFMGDTGSLALGGIIGICALLLRREVLLALAGGVFVAETLSVILQVGSYKLRNRKRIFLCTPLHHHFEFKGWPETKIVLRFWIISLILAIIGISSLKFQ